MPVYKRGQKRQNRVFTGSTDNFQELKNTQQTGKKVNLGIEGISGEEHNNHEPGRRKQRACGCASAVNIATPKHTVNTFSTGFNTCKEQVFEKVLRDTRKDRTQSNYQSMTGFWKNFQSRCKSKFTRTQKSSMWG